MSVLNTIHCIWLGSDLPAWAAANIVRLKAINPDRSVVLHTDDSLLHGDYRSLYDATPHWCQKADWLRYSLIETLGGWYLDVDWWAMKPLPDLEDLGDRLACLCGPSGPGWAMNGILACQPGSPALVAIRQMVMAQYPTDRNAGMHAITAAYRQSPEDFMPLALTDFSCGLADSSNYLSAKAEYTSHLPANLIAIHGNEP